MAGYSDDKWRRFDELKARPYFAAAVAANRAYLRAAVPDAAATAGERWTLSCLPRTNSGRLSTISMKGMETFVLFPPKGPDGNIGGFVIVRWSALDKHLAAGQSLHDLFPLLKFEDSTHGDDQVKATGRYDDLIAAFDDERFARAARDLATSLLTSRTRYPQYHNHPLADYVLGGESRPAEWIYPINESSDSWGYDSGVLEFFRAIRSGDVHDWYLAKCFHQIKAGDRIWVYATSPHQRIIAAGIAWSDPYQQTTGDDGQWRLEIRWDRPLTKFLLSHIVTASDVLEARVQTVRALRPEESARLAKALRDRSAPEPADLPEGRRRRLAQVTARQGQADFRRRLFEAYGGRCAISGCDVEAALQAAHIDPYDGPATNRTTNGLLLRADLHNLFDSGLLWIDGSYRVRVADGLEHYAEWNGRRLRLPARVEDRPDKEALRRQREEVANVL